MLIAGLTGTSGNCWLTNTGDRADQYHCVVCIQTIERGRSEVLSRGRREVLLRGRREVLLRGRRVVLLRERKFC